MKTITFKKWLKLGWSKDWTEAEDKAHRAAYHLGFQAGLKQAHLNENERKRLSKIKNKLAKQAAQS